MTARGGAAGSRLRDFLAAALAIAILDGALFHGGIYARIVKPASYSGRVEREARRLRTTLEVRPESRLVVVMGDSSTGSAVSEIVLDATLAAAKVDLVAMNVATGGAAPSTWPPILGSLPLSSSNTALVVLGIFPPALLRSTSVAPEQDLVKTRAGVLDALALARDHPELETRLSLACGALFRTPWYREDLRDLLADPGARRRALAVQAAREERVRLSWRKDNAARRSLASIDVSGGVASFAHADPAILRDAELKLAVENRMALLRAARTRPPEPQPDPRAVAAVVRTVREVTRREIPLALAVTPSSPWPFPCRSHAAVDAVAAALAAAGLDAALFQDEELLSALEVPRYFADTQHLNREGAAIYSSTLGSFLAARAGAPALGR